MMTDEKLAELRAEGQRLLAICSTLKLDHEAEEAELIAEFNDIRKKLEATPSHQRYQAACDAWHPIYEEVHAEEIRRG